MYSQYRHGYLVDTFLWNFDFFLLIFLTVTALIAIVVWTRFAPEYRRLIVVSAVLLAISLGFGGYRLRNEDMLARLYWNNRLSALAKSFAVAVGDMGLENLPAEPVTENDPAYKKIFRIFEKWQDQDEMVVNVCVFRKDKNGDLIYLVRPGADYDGDGKISSDLEEYAPPGKNYGPASDEPVLTDAYRTGKPQFTEFPYYAAGLPWLYAAVPIHPENGNDKNMILVVDFQAKQWLKNVRTARGAPLWGIVMILFVILTATVEIVLLQGSLKNEIRAKNMLAENELKYHKIIDNSHDVISLLENGRYVFCNQKMKDLFGLDESQIIGQLPPVGSPAVLPDGTDARAEAARQIRLTEQGTHQVFPWTHRRYDGTPIQTEVRLDPVEIDGKILVTAVIHDLTERYRAVEAEQASRTKSDFLAQMSHEIRTPLTGVIGLSDLLLETELSEKQREFASLVRESGKSLLFLINDILDFSKIEAGKLEIANESFDPLTTVRSVLGILTPRAEEKGLELREEFAPDVPRRILGDEGRIRQILLNLIGNALKFTETGRVTVQVSTVENDTKFPVKRQTVCFAVKDTGIGIPQEKIKQLGEAFTQVDSSSKRRITGTGLGLAISKSLVRLMHGEFCVESVPGQGSTFRFAIPFEIDSVADLDKDIAVESGIFVLPGQTGRRILVAEDNRINQVVVRETLLAAGFDCEIVADGLQAVQAFADKTNEFQLILMDCQMPEMDGMQATQEIRRLESLQRKRQRIPIIALTASATLEDSQRCLNAGMDAFCSKPINAKNLVKIIREWLKPVV